MELKLIFMLSSDVEVSDTAYGLNFRKEIEEVYVGDTCLLKYKVKLKYIEALCF